MSSATLQITGFSLTGNALEQRSYDPVLVRKWRQHGYDKRYKLRHFAQSTGWAEHCGGRTFAPFEVRVLLNGKRKLFRVDPHDQNWHSHLCSEISLALGLGPGRHNSIVLSFPDSSPLSGTLQDLDKLSALPAFQLVVGINDRAASASALEPAPILRLPGHYTTAVLSTSSSSSSSSSSDPDATEIPEIGGREISSAEARRLAADLVARLRDNVVRRIPEHVAGLKQRDYGSVRGEVLRVLSRPEFYGGEAEYNAFWASAKCRDVGAAITDLSSDIAAKVCKIDENLSAHRNSASSASGGLAPELCRNVLIGCSIWDSWRDKMRSWRSRRSYRVPVSCEAPKRGVYFEDERLFEIAAPIGAAAVDAVQHDLIASSLRYPYQTPVAHHCDDDDGYSSDENPSPESAKCAGRKKHYRCAHRPAPNSTQYELPNRIDVECKTLKGECKTLKGECKSPEVKCKEKKKTKTTTRVLSESLAIVPIAAEQMTMIGARRRNSAGRFEKEYRSRSPSHHHEGHAGSVTTMPTSTLTGDPLFEALKPIGCKTCGHGCPVCGKPLSEGCGHVKPITALLCPSCGQGMPTGVQPIDCACGWGRSKEKEKDQAPPTSAAKSTLEVAIEESLPTESTLPPHGQALLEVSRSEGKQNGADALTVHYSFVGIATELEPFVALRLGEHQTKQVKAGKYRVLIEDVATKKVLAAESEMLIIQRNRYRLRLDPEDASESGGRKKIAGGAATLEVVDRFEEQKLALASEFLSRSDVGEYLRTHPSGVLFAPSNAALAGRQTDVRKLAIAEFFASGNAVELLRKETEHEFTKSKELRVVTDGKRAFIRNSENTRCWNCNLAQNCNIEGTGKHPQFPQVVVVVVELLPSDVERVLV